MQIDFVNVVFTVLSLIALAIPGFILVKTKILGDNAAQVISNVVIYVCQPALVLLAFQGKEFNPELGLNMLIVFGLAIAIHLIMVAIVHIFIRNKSNSAKLNCLRYASIFGNCGFMGFPMIQSLFYGMPVYSEVIIYCAVVIASFNVLSWTLGVYIVSKDKKQISIKKILLNPTIIGVVLGFLIFIIAKKPLIDLCVEGSTGDIIITKFVRSIELLSNAVTPMAMIVIGMKLANANLKQIFLDKTAYICCLLKLVVASCVSILVTTFLPISSVIKYALFFLLSVPSATMTTMLAVKFNSDSNSASVMVLLTSILSMATIPLMFIFYTTVFGGFI
jgi:predicted permease